MKKRIEITRQMASEGVTGTEIAKTFRCSSTSVYRLMAKHGIKPRPPQMRNVRLDIKVEDVMELKGQGLAIYQIARALKCSETCVRSRYIQGRDQDAIQG